MAWEGTLVAVDDSELYTKLKALDAGLQLVAVDEEIAAAADRIASYAASIAAHLDGYLQAVDHLCQSGALGDAHAHGIAANANTLRALPGGLRTIGSSVRNLCTGYIVALDAADGFLY
jgi:hypothetical protein